MQDEDLCPLVMWVYMSKPVPCGQYLERYGDINALQYELDLYLCQHFKNVVNHGHILLFTDFMLDYISKLILYNQSFVR